jgi:two-component system, NtrC family, sensor kinase
MATAVSALTIDPRGAPAADTEARLDEISEALLRIASLDFEHPLPCRDDGTVIDGVIGCINMLAEELAVHVKEQARRSLDLEERVRARTADLEASIESQRKLESDLRQAHKLEAVGRLAAGIAHEINTPIQFVGDNLAFLSQAIDSVLALYGRTRALVAVADEEASRRLEKEADFGYLSEEMPMAIAQSVGGIAQVAEIVRAMKVFSHQEAASAQVPVDLRTAIESVLTVARSETREVADVILEVGDVPPVLAFGGSLNQVLLNLVVNAAHAVGEQVARTGQKGKISVRATRDGDDVVVAIEDTGVGIPDSIRDRLFEPFFTTKRVGEGSGQGLAHARAVVVERHGGTLTFESEVGRGTTFFVRLPIAGRVVQARSYCVQVAVPAAAGADAPPVSAGLQMGTSNEPENAPDGFPIGPNVMSK